jgi:regulatory protein YycH of two-component signal transduction system YycFG
MPDLTLNEYRDISEDALKPLIMDEERKMSGTDYPDKIIIEKTSCLHFVILLRKVFGKALQSLTLH